MVTSLISRALPPLRRLVLWLTGNQALHATLAAQEAGRSQLMASLDSLHKKVDALNGLLLPIPRLMDATIGTTASTEADRLDSIHAVSLHEKIDALRSEVYAMHDCLTSNFEKQLIEEFDRLDGNVVHHMTVLRAVLLARIKADEASVVGRSHS